MKKRYRNILRFSLGLFILFFLVYKIGFYEIYQSLLKIQPRVLIYILFIYILLFTLDSINYKILLLSTGNRVPSLKLFKYILLSWATGLFVPGKIGQFSIIYFLSKENVDFGKGTAIFLIDKVISLLVLSILSVAGFFLFFGLQIALNATLCLLFFFLALFFVLTKTPRALVKKHILRKYAEKFQGFSKTFYFYLKNKKKILLLNFILTLTKWVLTTIQVYILLKFTSTVNFIPVLLITAMVSISSLIPITVSGLGIKETVAVFLFRHIGVRTASSAGVLLVLNGINYLIASLIIFLFFREVLEDKKINSINISDKI